jgi:hypothetical protein
VYDVVWYLHVLVTVYKCMLYTVMCVYMMMYMYLLMIMTIYQIAVSTYYLKHAAAMRTECKHNVCTLADIIVVCTPQ